MVDKKELIEYFIKDADIISVNTYSVLTHFVYLVYILDRNSVDFFCPPKTIKSELIKSSFACFSRRNSGL